MHVVARGIHNHDWAPMAIIALQEHLAGGQLVADLVLQQAARRLGLMSIGDGAPPSQGLQKDQASSQPARVSSCRQSGLQLQWLHCRVLGSLMECEAGLSRQAAATVQSGAHNQEGSDSAQLSIVPAA